MAELARDVELLIDFGGERWHERFKEDAKCEECVQCSVYNLLTSLLRSLLLVEIPWLELLEVAIAVT